jgi:hypothetical protein
LRRRRGELRLRLQEVVMEANKLHRPRTASWALTVAFGFCLPFATAQEHPVREEMTGTVISASINTLVLRTDDNQFRVFVFESYTQKPKSMSTGSVVRVISIPGREPGVRVAEQITVVKPAVAPKAGEPAPEPEVVPQEVRALESDLKRQVKRFGAGVRMGTALDPELFMLGIQARMGPIFTRDLWFRPNLEIGFGEVTGMIGVNLEFVYRLPISAREGKWSTYFGAGPALNFTNQDFEREDANTSIHWGDFSYKTGFNILMGMQHRKGPFVEVKTSIYSEPSPVLRLIAGYTF